MVEQAQSWWTTERGLLPNLIKKERLTQTTPIFVLASPEGIVEQFTYADVENLTNRAAWFLRNALDEDEEKFFYMGRGDLRYYIWVIAAMKAGKCAVIPSPSNTVAANQLLFNDVGAKKLLFSPEKFEILQALHDASKEDVKWIETPKWEDLMSKEPVPEFPFNYTFEEVQNKPWVGLHTSGTTGHPKPIYWTHAAIPLHASHVDRPYEVSDPTKETMFQQIFQEKITLGAFPLYHAGGMISLLASVICGCKTLVLPATGTRLTPENVTGILEVTRPDAGLLVPAVVEPMLKYSPGLEALGRLKHVVYAGGPMNPTAGEKLSQLLPHLTTMIGSTEAAIQHTESTTDSTHWDCFKFIDVGQRMEEVEPGLYELVYPRTDMIHKTHLIFHSLPDLDVYRTKDLYEPAEGKPGWWVYRGRADNWIAMSNGLKFDPRGTEDIIGSHPDVSAALVAGARRFRLCLLIELDESSGPPASFDSADQERDWRARALDKIWPAIEQANHKAPKFGRIPKELVLFAAKNKPFKRTPKGSIQRRLVLADYEKEIEELYARSEQGLLTSGLPPLKSATPEDLVPFLQELYSQTLEVENLGPNDDVFSHGMDSFAVASLSSRLKAALRAYGTPSTKLNEIGIRLMYKATTATQMAEQLSSILSESNGTSPHVNGANSDVSDILDKYEGAAQELVEKYAGEATSNGINGNHQNGSKHGHVVAVTGTTGSMGSYLLATLLARSDVDKVICLNRAADGKEKQAKALESRGLPALQPFIDQGRVVFMKIDIAAPRLGLTDDEYTTILQETTSIVHNAFPVNFLMTVKQFEPQFVGVLSLLELALIGKRHPSFLVVSSVGAAASTVAKDVIPEVVFDRENVKTLAIDGYGAAKFICERMTHVFAAAAAKGGKHVATSVLRVGQVTGPIEGIGAWNKWEWLPSIVISSQYLGAAPDTIGLWTNRIDWIPVDELARIMSDLVDASEQHKTSSNSPETVVYNLVNPQVTVWNELLQAVKGMSSEIETVPISEWLHRLEQTKDESAHILERNPGLKLIDFYKGLLGGSSKGLTFATDNLVRDSGTAAKLGPITQDDMVRWIKGWNL